MGCGPCGVLCSPRATAIYVLFFSIVFAGLAVLLGVWTPAAFWLCAGVFGGGIAVAVVGGLTTLSLSIYYLRSLCNNRWPWAPTQKAGAGVEEDDSRRARVLAMSQLRASTSADGSADAYRVAPLIDSTSPFSKDPSFVSLASGVGPSGTAGVGARSDGGGCCRCGFPCVLRSFASTLCVLSVIIALVATGIVGFLRVRTLPDLTSPSLNVGPTAVSGLAAPSTILREQGTGILHISAQSEADLFWSQGFAHAQRRLWQMEFQRRVGSGTLSAVVGSGGLDIDKTMRVLGMYAAAEAAFPVLSNRSQTVLNAYAAGVNAYISGVNARKPGFAVPMELYLIGPYQIAPWKPADSIVWAKVMSYSLGGNMDRELTRYKLSAQRNLSVARVYELLPNFDTARFPTILSEVDLQAPYFPSGDGLASDATAGGASGRRELAHPIAAALARARELEAELAAKALAQGKAPVSAGRRAAAAAAPAAASAPGQSCSAADVEASRRLLESMLRGAAADNNNNNINADSSASSSEAASSLLSSMRLLSRGYSGVPRLGRGKVRGSGARASNNWVVGPNMTKSGKPLLCNDPHLQLMAPSVWLLNHLHSTAAGYDVLGASFVGIPGIVLGRNARIAWAVTNTGADVQDLYMMTELPGNTTHYLYRGAWTPYSTRSEVIKVKGDADTVLTVRTSVYGAVVTDYGVVDGSGTPMSLRWVSTDPTIPDTTLDAFISINTAASYADFRAALSSYIAPSQNFIYADVDGNFGYQMSGLVPQRNVTAGFDGAWPVPGEGDPRFDWGPRIPFTAMPATYNPPEGFIATANNRVTPVNYSGVFITDDWDSESDGYRAARITEMIQASVMHDVASMQAIQHDTLSLWAKDVIAIIAALPPSLLSSPGAKALQTRFTAWDGNMAVNSYTATLFAELWQRLATLGTVETDSQYWGNNVFLLNALTSDATPAGTDVACKNAGYTTCNAYLAGQLESVAAQYGLGSNGSPSGGDAGKIPRWGTDVHQATALHQILDGSPLQCLADRKIAHGGDDNTVSVGSIDLPGENDKGLASTIPFAQTHGSSFRHVSDLSTPDAAQWVNFLGEDGALISKQYDTELSAWANGGYYALSLQLSSLGSATAQSLLPQ